MQIRLKKKKERFAQVHQNLLFSKISFKAKGIGSLLEFYSDGWELSLDFLIQKSKEGREAVRAGIKELEEAGFLHRHQEKDPKNGQFVTIWEFDSEGLTPEFDQNPAYGFSVCGSPVDGSPADGKSPPIYNNNKTDQNILYKNSLFPERVSQKKEEEEKVKNHLQNLVQHCKAPKKGSFGNFKDFKNWVVSNYPQNFTFYLKLDPWLPNTPFSLLAGFVAANGVVLKSDEAAQVWAHLFKKQDVFLPLMYSEIEKSKAEVVA